MNENDSKEFIPSNSKVLKRTSMEIYSATTR